MVLCSAIQHWGFLEWSMSGEETHFKNTSLLATFDLTPISVLQLLCR